MMPTRIISVLIYQQRRQYSEAIWRFERAVEIDPDLTSVG